MGLLDNNPQDPFTHVVIADSLRDRVSAIFHKYGLDSGYIDSVVRFIGTGSPKTSCQGNGICVGSMLSYADIKKSWDGATNLTEFLKYMKSKGFMDIVRWKDEAVDRFNNPAYSNKQGMGAGKRNVFVVPKHKFNELSSELYFINPIISDDGLVLESVKSMNNSDIVSSSLKSIIDNLDVHNIGVSVESAVDDGDSVSVSLVFSNTQISKESFDSRGLSSESVEGIFKKEFSRLKFLSKVSVNVNLFDEEIVLLLTYPKNITQIETRKILNSLLMLFEVVKGEELI